MINQTTATMQAIYDARGRTTPTAHTEQAGQVLSYVERWYVADRKLWLTADGSQVVDHGHQDADSLYCVPGQLIPYASAAQYGLVDDTQAAGV